MKGVETGDVSWFGDRDPLNESIPMYRVKHVAASKVKGAHKIKAEISGFNLAFSFLVAPVEELMLLAKNGV